MSKEWWKPAPDREVMEAALDKLAETHPAEAAQIRRHVSGMKRLAVVLAVALVPSLVYGIRGWNAPTTHHLTPQASTRMAEATAFDYVLRIEAYAEANGRLPGSLSEAGMDLPPGAPVTYTPQGADGYTLEIGVAVGGGVVTYTRGDDLMPFARAAGVPLEAQSPEEAGSGEPGSVEG